MSSAGSSPRFARSFDDQLQRRPARTRIEWQDRGCGRVVVQRHPAARRVSRRRARLRHHDRSVLRDVVVLKILDRWGLPRQVTAATCAPDSPSSPTGQRDPTARRTPRRRPRRPAPAFRKRRIGLHSALEHDQRLLGRPRLRRDPWADCPSAAPSPRVRHEQRRRARRPICSATPHPTPRRSATTRPGRPPRAGAGGWPHPAPPLRTSA